MKTEVICRGLPASWINAWLAAVGATVLSPKLRLRWTAESMPRAALSAEEADPIEILSAVWPARAALDALPIAERWGDSPSVARKVAVDSFAGRVRAARSHPFSWTLSSTMTDLHVDASGEVAHAPFDPAGPGTIKWLHHRLVKVHGKIRPSTERLLESLQGTAPRVKDNGLGFDQTRLASQADGTGKWVEPVVEVLAFFGLAMLPFRGTGTDERLRKAARSSAIQRGWRRTGNGQGELYFSWPAWRHPLDFAGIDSLLDLWTPDRKNWPSVGVHAAWRSVSYRPKATADTTRGFGAERL